MRFRSIRELPHGIFGISITDTFMSGGSIVTGGSRPRAEPANCHSEPSNTH